MKYLLFEEEIEWNRDRDRLRIGLRGLEGRKEGIGRVGLSRKRG